MPCLNSSGKLARDVSSSPSARNPFHVKATVTHRALAATDECTSAADCTLSRRPVSHARPDSASRNETKMYSPLSAGVRVSRMCWMSSNSSMSTMALLHLVEHDLERILESQRLLDLLGAHIRVLGVLKKTRTLVLPNELNECWSVRLPIFWEAFEVLEHGVDAVFREQCHRVFGVLVEVGVEDALIHEEGVGADVEENPAQVMQLEDGETIRQSGDRVFDLLPVFSNRGLSPGFDLRDDREAITRGRFREDRTVSPLLEFEEPVFRDRHGGGVLPVGFRGVRRHLAASRE